jgi:ATP adenylyltransferase
MDYLFNSDKIHYVKGKKPDVSCILCAIRDRHPDVECLEVADTENFIISLNLYPFNPAHCMIFPRRHIADPSELADDEALEMHRLLKKTLRVLVEEFGPSGFNIGYNLGRGSGASIGHLHLHIVPRYENEVGFLDVLAGARVIVLDPREAMERMKKRFSS